MGVEVCDRSVSQARALKEACEAAAKTKDMKLGSGYRSLVTGRRGSISVAERS